MDCYLLEVVAIKEFSLSTDSPLQLSVEESDQMMFMTVYNTSCNLKIAIIYRHTINIYGIAWFSDDDRIVSHDASRLGLYYHCVRDVIIHFTLSG